ncbi:hypothetical protein ACF08N_34210 [Streptomyces sp. NPDC015127]|uniref:hypothetical protein n=1 Tax=Streptomyces sp. NPDC015127 TaxID=3364939 RepID=UPI003701BAE6
MWRELIRELAPDAGLGAPAEPGALRAAEDALGGPLPRAPAGLLAECDGALGPGGLDVVRETERIRRDNWPSAGSPPSPTSTCRSSP